MLPPPLELKFSFPLNTAWRPFWFFLQSGYQQNTHSKSVYELLGLSLRMEVLLLNKNYRILTVEEQLSSSITTMCEVGTWHLREEPPFRSSALIKHSRVPLTHIISTMIHTHRIRLQVLPVLDRRINCGANFLGGPFSFTRASQNAAHRIPGRESSLMLSICVHSKAPPF